MPLEPLRSLFSGNIKTMGIVLSTTSLHKERFFVFLKWLFIGYFRLGQVILCQVIAPQGQVIGPAGLEPPAGARNRRKATVKNTKNRPIRCVATKGTISFFDTLICSNLAGYPAGYPVIWPDNRIFARYRRWPDIRPDTGYPAFEISQISGIQHPAKKNIRPNPTIYM